MIVVTGASGALGSRVVESLLGRVPADRIGISARDPDKLTDLQERGVRVRHGDFTDPESLTDAFEGATKVLVVAVATTGEVRMRQHRTAIDAAVAAGAGRILYTSHMGARPSSPFPPMPDHAATEELLRASGVAFTGLRNGFYASSAAMTLGDAVQTGELVGPEDGPIAWTAHEDLAEVTARTLADDVLDGVTAPLTASEAVDLAGIATIAAQLTGRPIRRVVLSDDDYRSHLMTRGLPERAADFLVGMFAASRRGDFATTDPTLASLLGRPPIAVAEVLGASIRRAA